MALEEQVVMLGGSRPPCKARPLKQEGDGQTAEEGGEEGEAKEVCWG